MQITVYADIIFLISFLISFYVVMITGWIIKEKISIKRAGVSALFEALSFLPLLFFPHLIMGIKGVILSTLISMGTIIIAFGFKPGVIKRWFLSTTVLVFVGGIFNFIKNVFSVQKITIYIWMILFLISGVIAVVTIRFFIRIKGEREKILPVVITNCERECNCKLFVDTGNRLYDPLFKKPVILLSEKIVEKLLSDKELLIVKEYKKKGCIDYQNPIVLKSQKNICFHEVYYKSVGRSSGKLLCLLVDSVEVIAEKKVINDQPIAIADETLFTNREYKGLMYSDDV